MIYVYSLGILAYKIILGLRRSTSLSCTYYVRRYVVTTNDMEETLHKTKVDIMTTVRERITMMNQRTANIEANMNTLKVVFLLISLIKQNTAFHLMLLKVQHWIYIPSIIQKCLEHKDISRPPSTLQVHIKGYRRVLCEQPVNDIIVIPDDMANCIQMYCIVHSCYKDTEALE